jgi:hypothetical protein
MNELKQKTYSRQAMPCRRTRRHDDKSPEVGMAAGILDPPPGGRGYLMLARFSLLIRPFESKLNGKDVLLS